MDIVIVGIDLGKNSCSLAGLDASGRVVLRRRMRRSAVGSFVTSLRRCVVAMEACCGAHHLGRVFGAQGHEVRLMSPEYVHPYVKAQKNDDLDAAIAEAASRPTMRVCRGQEPGSIGHSGAASRARTAGVGAHRADQPFARVAAGAWDRGAAGPAQTGRTAFDLRGRRWDRGAEPAH